jgi:pantetheine-phosphate adenylyltransferase
VSQKYSVVGLGGTFDRLHKGHEALIQKAFEIGVQVLIGITSDEMLFRKNKAKEIQPYARRVNNIKNYLKNNDLIKRSEIIKLKDPYGPAVTRKEMEVIIVTKETHPNAEKINDLRKKNGLTPLIIVIVSRILAEDGLPISSSRIRAGIIDKNGASAQKT